VSLVLCVWGQLYWTRIKKVYYGCTKEDATEIGFDDKKIYGSFHKKAKNYLLVQKYRKSFSFSMKECEQKDDKVLH
jgi:guanine deaminase